MSFVIDPRGMANAKDWCDQMTPYLEKYGQIPRLENSTNWRIWGTYVQQLPSISKFNPPNPWDFSDWVEWANRFNQCLNS